jgi:hypothetical protein
VEWGDVDAFHRRFLHLVNAGEWVAAGDARPSGIKPDDEPRREARAKRIGLRQALAGSMQAIREAPACERGSLSFGNNRGLAQAENKRDVLLAIVNEGTMIRRPGRKPQRAPAAARRGCSKQAHQGSHTQQQG